MECHGCVMAQHFGENKSIMLAKELGNWVNMEAEIIDYIKKCHVCQIQKLQRIKHKTDAIIPLPLTLQHNEYILSIKIQLKNATLKSIIEGLFYHYIYTFGTPKYILTDQEQNVVSQLIQNFENLFRIRHVKTTTFYPQSNGSLERTHATIKDLIRAAMSDNHSEWDLTLKFIFMAYNTMNHKGTGFSPFKLTFGRNANLPSVLATTPCLKFDRKCKNK